MNCWLERHNHRNHRKRREVPGKGKQQEGGDMGGAGLGRDKWKIAGPSGVGLSQ